jgi:hypothetical protein
MELFYEPGRLPGVVFDPFMGSGPELRATLSWVARSCFLTSMPTMRSTSFARSFAFASRHSSGLYKPMSGVISGPLARVQVTPPRRRAPEWQGTHRTARPGVALVTKLERERVPASPKNCRRSVRRGCFVFHL